MCNQAQNLCTYRNITGQQESETKMTSPRKPHLDTFFFSFFLLISKMIFACHSKQTVLSHKVLKDQKVNLSESIISFCRSFLCHQPQLGEDRGKQILAVQLGRAQHAP